MAITPAFQAGDVGSIPIIRSRGIGLLKAVLFILNDTVTAVLGRAHTEQVLGRVYRTYLN